ncbi:MAG: class I SAM-dependent methyltransferase [Candidatus Tagabacteria bacterium]
MNPAKVIENLDLGPAMTVADFGCGSGHYAIEAAKKVGKSGKVYALDIQQEMLSFVRSQAKLMGLINIETVRADLETPNATNLRENSVDLVIISNILFQAENKKQIIQEAFRILKSGGRTATVEWDVENQAASPDGRQGIFGPQTEKRVTPQNVKDLFAESGFIFEKEFNPGEHHFGLIFRKK